MIVVFRFRFGFGFVTRSCFGWVYLCYEVFSLSVLSVSSSDATAWYRVDLSF
jgi:hypothetical protein